MVMRFLAVGLLIKITLNTEELFKIYLVIID